MGGVERCHWSVEPCAKARYYPGLVSPKDKWLVILPVRGQEGMRGAAVGLVSVYVHHFSASERIQAEKLTLRLGVVIDGFRRLYCAHFSTGSPNIKHYSVDTIKGVPSGCDGTEADLLPNSSNSDTWLLFQA